MKNKVYPRPHDQQTVYLKDVITTPNIEVGDYTIYNDFVHDPRDFEKNILNPFEVTKGAFLLCVGRHMQATRGHSAERLGAFLLHKFKEIFSE